MSVSMVDCERCGNPVADPDNPPKIGNAVYCEDCHDRICGNCLKEIPDPDDRYDIESVGPGTTCPTCTARYVSWMCNGCGTELPDEEDQFIVEEDSQYDGTYCSECVAEAKERAKADEARPSGDEKPPF